MRTLPEGNPIQLAQMPWDWLQKIGGEAGTLLPGGLHDRTRDATTGRLACNHNGSMGTLRCLVAT